jgi:hypothetical protein
MNLMPFEIFLILANTEDSNRDYAGKCDEWASSNTIPSGESSPPIVRIGFEIDERFADDKQSEGDKLSKFHGPPIGTGFGSDCFRHCDRLKSATFEPFSPFLRFHARDLNAALALAKSLSRDLSIVGMEASSCAELAVFSFCPSPDASIIALTPPSANLEQRLNVQPV